MYDSRRDFEREYDSVYERCRGLWKRRQKRAYAERNAGDSGKEIDKAVLNN
jgi:hypothetical protein